MEEWQLNFEWLRVCNIIKEALGKDKIPDLEAVLLLVGIQESMIFKDEYTKEEKQDLMHIGTCHLLSEQGFFEFKGRDADGWPFYDQIKTIPMEGHSEQELFLKECVINYFKEVKQDII